MCLALKRAALLYSLPIKEKYPKLYLTKESGVDAFQTDVNILSDPLQTRTSLWQYLAESYTA